MVGTFIGLILGLVAVFFGQQKTEAVQPLAFSLIFSALPTFFLALYPLIYCWLLSPLQRAEENTTPRLLEMLKKDPRLGFNHLGIVLFSLMALGLGVDAASTNFIALPILVGTWFLFIGICTDLFVYFLRRAQGYLNPFTAIELFGQAAKRSVQSEKEADLCEWIDALSETANCALDKGGVSLCNRSVREINEVLRVFLEASKSLGHRTEDEQSKELGIKDKVSFTLFYAFQRLEQLFHKALEKRFEPVCSCLLTTIGKIVIDAARYDISLARYPLQVIGRLGSEAQIKRINDVGLKTTCLYLELAKVLLSEIDITYLELKEPFFTMIHYMDQLAKEAFKQNKNIPIAALAGPFEDLKTMFKAEKVAAHQDAAAITADINRVLAEFDALAQVLRTIPPLSSLAGDLSPSAKPEETP